jgi:hypothetical protein
MSFWGFGLTTESTEKGKGLTAARDTPGDDLMPVPFPVSLRG